MTFTRDFRDAQQAAGEIAASPLARELQISASEPWGSVGLDTAISVASVKLMIAAWDHLGSIRMLLQPDGMTLFGHTVLGRAAVEAAGRAYRILEPGIGPRLRVARSVTERLASTVEAGRTQNGLGHDLGYQQRLDDLLAEATSYGLARQADKKGKPINAFEERRPSATEVASDFDRYLTLHGWPRPEWDSRWVAARNTLLRSDLLP